jgi:uncharacterized protein (TIRG00374 family)
MRKKLLNLLKVLISLGLVYWLVQKLDWTFVIAELQNIKPGYIVLFVILQLTAMGLSAKKWQVIAKFQGIHFTVWEGFKTYLTGTFINNFLPATIGGDIYRSLWLVDRGARKGKAFSTVIFDRFLGLIMTSTLALIGGFFVWRFIDLPAFLVLSYTLVFGLLVFFGLWIAFERTVFVQGLVTRISWVKLRNLFAESLRYNALDIWKTAGLWTTLFMLVGLGLSNYVLFLALGYTLPFFPFLGLVFLMALYVSFPISISNIGVKEWAYGVLFVLLGVSFETAVTVALLSRFLQTGISLCALPIYLKETSEKLIQKEESVI